MLPKVMSAVKLKVHVATLTKMDVKMLSTPKIIWVHTDIRGINFNDDCKMIKESFS